MAENKKCLTPLLKQLFVVVGVSMNMGTIGSMMGFSANLLPQLRSPDSYIQVDDLSSSWIASIVGLSLMCGNLLVPTVLRGFGRRTGSIISCTTMLISWVWIVLATDVASLLIARFLQGISVGVNFSLAPMMIAEYTSPINRGIFSTIMTGAITVCTLLVHVLGSYTTWQNTALVCAFISCGTLAILVFSPESPSWLADQERYDDSVKAFRWLRGDSEDTELEKMIEARKQRDVTNGVNYKDNSKNFVANIIEMIRRRDFYRPVVIMIHLFTLGVWSGMVFLIVYSVDVLHTIGGMESDADVAMHLTILNIQRIFSTFIALVIIKKLKRRTILFSGLGLNVAALVASSVFTFAKTKLLSFHHPAIGMTLIHIHMFSITISAVPLPLIISGELFPLEFRSIASGISASTYSLNFFIASKIVLSLVKAIGIHGMYVLYAVVTVYCMVVVWIMLPETKDRTLQDIEEEFKGNPMISKELGSTRLLKSKKNGEEA